MWRDATQMVPSAAVAADPDPPCLTDLLVFSLFSSSPECFEALKVLGSWNSRVHVPLLRMASSRYPILRCLECPSVPNVLQNRVPLLHCLQCCDRPLDDRFELTCTIWCATVHNQQCHRVPPPPLSHSRHGTGHWLYDMVPDHFSYGKPPQHTDSNICNRVQGLSSMPVIPPPPLLTLWAIGHSEQVLPLPSSLPPCRLGLVSWREAGGRRIHPSGTRSGHPGSHYPWVCQAVPIGSDCKHRCWTYGQCVPQEVWREGSPPAHLVANL